MEFFYNRINGIIEKLDSNDFESAMDQLSVLLNIVNIAIDNTTRSNNDYFTVTGTNREFLINQHVQILGILVGYRFLPDFCVADSDNLKMSLKLFRGITESEVRKHNNNKQGV